MSTIRILKHLDSETLHLPELRSLVGKDVTILVEERMPEQKPYAGPMFTPRPPPDSLPPVKSFDEIMKEQGVRQPMTVERAAGHWPKEEKNDGFEAWIRQQRKEELDAEIRSRKSDN